MKKLLFSAFVAIVMLSSCNKNDIDALEDRVTALEKSTTVIGVKFVENQMVVTYSDSETETINMPGGLVTLEDGDGKSIQSITYNETTNLLTIKLTNGNESVFRIINNGYESMVAMLISDVNGKMYVSQISMGAVPYATIEYDANFNMTRVLSKTLVDNVIMNNFEVNKVYTDNVLSGLQYIEYATERYVEYNTNNYSYVDTTMTTQVPNYSKGNSIDSTYRYYAYNYFDGAAYHYNIFPLAVKRVSTYFSDIVDSYYGVYDENTAYYFQRINYTSETVDGITTYTAWYRISQQYLREGTYEIGDIEWEENHTLNSNGNPEKIYNDDDEYIQLTYNDAMFVTKAEEYELVDDEWIKDDEYLTFEYNAENQLTEVLSNFEDKDTVVFKTVYDANGNPVEIYAWGKEQTSYFDYFDPFGNPDDPWQSGDDVLLPEGLQLMVTIDYDYHYKNFFGNTIGAVVPALQNYKIYNAPIRVSYAQRTAYAALEYGNFNEGGYPESVKANIYGNYYYKNRKSTSKEIDPSNYSVELAIEYITKE